MEQVIDIVKESSELLCADLPLLLFVTLIFLFPVSAISLTQILHIPAAAARIHTFLSAHFRQSPSPPPILYSQSLQTVAADIASFPAALILKLAAYVAVWHLATWRRAGRSRDLEAFLAGGAAAWRRVAATYACGEAARGLLLAIFAAVVVKGSAVMNAAAVLALTSALPLAMVAARVALVASALIPALWGPKAILYSLSILKLRRRIAPALFLLLFSSFSAAFFEFAFHTRILDLRRMNSASASSLAPPLPPSAALGRFLEAPLLIFGHSFVSLFDCILCFSYFHLASDDRYRHDSFVSADAWEQLQLFGNEESEFGDVVVEAHGRRFMMDSAAGGGGGGVDEEFHEDHFSVAVEILERQCRKVMGKKL